MDVSAMKDLDLRVEIDYLGARYASFFRRKQEYTICRHEVPYFIKWFLQCTTSTVYLGSHAMTNGMVTHEVEENSPTISEKIGLPTISEMIGPARVLLKGNEPFACWVLERSGTT